MVILKFILGLQHTMNPLHLYCRLLNAGLSKDVSVQICQCYELIIFRWILYLSHTSKALLFLTREKLASRHITSNHSRLL